MRYPLMTLATGPVTTRRFAHKSFWQSIADTYAQRDLLRALVGREIRQRYVGTVLGVLWIVLQPALLVAFYTFIFSVVFKIRTGDDVQALSGGRAGHLDYALFVLGGLVPWLAFADGVNRASASITANKAIITKVLFPVELLPMAAVASAQVAFVATTGIVLVMAGLTLGLTPYVFWFPLLSLLLLMLALGLGYFLAVISTFFRDMTNVIPFMLTLGLYGSPVLYSRATLPPMFQKLMFLNPVAPILEAYRAAVVYGKAPDLASLGTSVAFSVGTLLFGFWLFRRAQQLFTEVL